MDRGSLSRRAFLCLGTMITGTTALASASEVIETYVLPNKGVTYRNIERIIEKYPEAQRYIPLVLDALERHQHIFHVDPVLFLGLIKRESNFGRNLISPVGAAGPVQFMPSTAQSMEMKVYLPEPNYFEEARLTGRKAYRARQRAFEHFQESRWDQAIEQMKESLVYQEQAKTLYERYRSELRALTEGKSDAELGRIDERFVDSMAVDKGLAHLAHLLKQREGDVREALSAYNAGLGAVKRAYGIPYIEETVVFQNRIVNFYKYWAPRVR